MDEKLGKLESWKTGLCVSFIDTNMKLRQMLPSHLSVKMKGGSNDDISRYPPSLELLRYETLLLECNRSRHTRLARYV